jgi:hypothetical protein
MTVKRPDPAKLAKEIDAKQSAYISGGHMGQRREPEPAVGSPEWEAMCRARRERVWQIEDDYPANDEGYTTPVSIRADMSIEQAGEAAAAVGSEEPEDEGLSKRVRDVMRKELPRLKAAIWNALAPKERAVFEARLKNPPVPFRAIAEKEGLVDQSHARKLWESGFRKVKKFLLLGSSRT